MEWLSNKMKALQRHNNFATFVELHSNYAIHSNCYRASGVQGQLSTPSPSHWLQNRFWPLTILKFTFTSLVRPRLGRSINIKFGVVIIINWNYIFVGCLSFCLCVCASWQQKIEKQIAKWQRQIKFVVMLQQFWVSTTFCEFIHYSFIQFLVLLLLWSFLLAVGDGDGSSTLMVCTNRKKLDF
jgi:hypothetical protein